MSLDDNSNLHAKYPIWSAVQRGEFEPRDEPDFDKLVADGTFKKNTSEKKMVEFYVEREQHNVDEQEEVDTMLEEDERLEEGD